MTTPKEPATGTVETSFKPRPTTWPGLLGTLTLLVGAATVIFHLLGLVVHQTYLGAWNISSTPFPKSTDWLLLNGYYGVWSGFAMLLSALLKNFHWIAIGATLLLLYLRLLFSSWNAFNYANEKLSWLQYCPAWLKQIGLWISAGTLVAALLIPLTLVLFLLIGLPARVGKTIGIETFASHFKDAVKGCEASKGSCIQIFKNGEPIGTGYLLDSSSTHLAYYDTQLKRARVIPIHGLEMRAWRSPAAP
ncbi:hypothetical protein [Hydrogenophaga sp.]|uniref:hypothetical protein n=1 Tax=Hydrogenophaga sp. TaxID=1904254 RepID=UPI002FCC5458